jgi:hypothetical protein
MAWGLITDGHCFAFIFHMLSVKSVHSYFKSARAVLNPMLHAYIVAQPVGELYGNVIFIMVLERAC